MILGNIRTILTAGIVATVLFLCAYSNMAASLEYNSTTAQITDIQNDGTNYKITVSYSINSTNYSGTVVVASANHYIGDNIEIDYDKNNYNNIMMHTDKSKSALYSCIAGIVCAVLFAFALIGLKQEVAHAEKMFE